MIRLNLSFIKSRTLKWLLNESVDYVSSAWNSKSFFFFFYMDVELAVDLPPPPPSLSNASNLVVFSHKQKKDLTELLQ